MENINTAMVKGIHQYVETRGLSFRPQYCFRLEKPIARTGEFGCHYKPRVETRGYLYFTPNGVKN